MNPKSAVRAVWARIRRHGRKFTKFCLVGASGVVVNLGIFTALLHIGFSVYPADLGGILVGSVSNYTLNWYWGVISRE